MVELFRKFLTLPARTTGKASLLFYALVEPAGEVRQDGLPKLGGHSQLVVAN